VEFPTNIKTNLKNIKELEMKAEVKIEVIEEVEGMEVRNISKVAAHSIEERPELVNKIMKYAFKKHILIEGEKGSGKTYSISKFLDQEGIDTVFLAGHEGLESIDLLGYLIPDKSGELVWKDGALTEAFRRAQDHPVVMFFDELLRVPGRELNLLVGALSPNSRGEYVLRTGRVLEVINGIAIEETLVVPSQNLWVIGTTNVGAGYAVDEIDEALSDRFRIVRKDTDKDEMRTILKKVFPETVAKSDAEAIVGKLMKIYSYMGELRKKGDLTKIVNMRHLVEAVQFSDFTEEGVVNNLLDLIPHWVDRDTDGYLNDAQKELIMKSIQRAFNI
jgi:MoxR-like ATPase